MNNLAEYSRFSFFMGLIAISFLLVSCGGLKSQGNSGKNLYESFYKSDGQIQYYIKPLEFEDGSQLLLLDFTILSGGKDSVVMNFSVFRKDPLKQLESIHIASGGFSVHSEKVNLMFVELEKRNFKNRFTSVLPVDDVKKLFENAEWEVTLKGDSYQQQFYPGRKTETSINQLNRAVIQLVD